MKCTKCNGKGWVTNTRYYRHSPSWSWEHDISPIKPCKDCKGSGYIIGNINDIVDRLKSAVNGVTITQQEIKQMLYAICKN